MTNHPQNLREKLKTPQGIFVFYSSFVAFASVLVLSGMLLSPSEPGNTIFMGLSLPRLIFALGMLIMFGIFTSITIKAWRNQAWA